jgi:hypothetical protein
LVKIEAPFYGKNSAKHSLFAHMKNATCGSFELEEMTFNDVLTIANDQFGGLHNGSMASLFLNIVCARPQPKPKKSKSNRKILPQPYHRTTLER